MGCTSRDVFMPTSESIRRVADDWPTRSTCVHLYTCAHTRAREYADTYTRAGRIRQGFVMRDQRCGVTAILIRTLALYHVNCRAKSLPPRQGNTCRTFRGYVGARRSISSRARSREGETIVRVRGRSAPRKSITNLRLARFLNLHFNFALREDRWDELLSLLIFGLRTELPLISTERANLTSIKRPRACTLLLIYSRRKRRRRTT